VQKIQPVWPLAEEVARVIVAAAKIEDLDPIAVADGSIRAPRARAYALIALGFRFPSINRTALARICGDRKKDTSANIVARGAVLRRSSDWFDLSRLNEVCAAAGWPEMSERDAVNATSAVWALAEAARLAGGAEIAPAPEIAAGEALIEPSEPANESESTAADAEPEEINLGEIEPQTDVDSGEARAHAGKFDPPRGAAAETLALGTYSCRWPMGDPSSPDFRYCGAPSIPGSEPMYCQKHAAIHAADNRGREKGAAKAI
jgi:hypothetical protein